MLLIHLSDSEGMCCFLGFLAMIFPGRFNFFFLRASRAPCVCVWENDSHILISYSFLRYLCLSSSLGIIPLQCYWPELDDTPVLQLQSCHSKVNSEWSEWTQTWAICLSWGVEPWVELTFCLQGGMEWWFGSTFFFSNEYVFDNGRETGKLNSMGQMPWITGFKLEKQSLTNYSHYCVFLELWKIRRKSAE